MKQVKNFRVVWDGTNNRYLLFHRCYQFADVVWGGRDRIEMVDCWVGGPAGLDKSPALVIPADKLADAVRAACRQGRTIKIENWEG